MSMYRQLWLAIVVSTLLALAGSLFASLLSARGYLESQLTIKNTDNATALALSLSQGKPDAVMADLVVASLFDGGHYELIRITDPMGKLITERVAPADVLDAPRWFARMLPLHAQPGVAQITSGWQQFGSVMLVSHSRFAYGALWKSAYEMVFALAVAGVVGGYLGSMVLRRLRGPLEAVIAQAKAITQRRFVTIEEPKVPELQQLALAMNATVGRLKAMFDDEASRLELVRKEANFDPLTGLANRSHFMAQLRQALDADDAQGGCLMLIRLADLAELNRHLGRKTTDELLQHAALAVSGCAAQCGHGVAARLNGADFALLVPAQAQAGELAQRLLAELVQALAALAHGEAVVWIGVGQFSHKAEIGALLAGVDFALARAEAGGQSAVYEAPLDGDEDLPRTADQWARLIQRALENDWVRLISFPVVDAQGRLSHRECPLRLMFDDKGEWLPAGRFLPFAERLKLTPALDLAAVKLGLQELKMQPNLAGLAINLSASSLESADFRKSLFGVLQAHSDLAPRLWLEVAEGGAHKHLGAFRELCLALSALKCRMGLEHFGHHFNQIGLLHDVGLDYIKVDASFVRDVQTNEGNAAFLKGLCTMSHNIGLQVFAEGVATQAELDALVGLGFDGATGPGIHESIDD